MELWLTVHIWKIGVLDKFHPLCWENGKMLWRQKVTKINIYKWKDTDIYANKIGLANNVQKIFVSFLPACLRLLPSATSKQNMCRAPEQKQWGGVPILSPPTSQLSPKLSWHPPCTLCPHSLCVQQGRCSPVPSSTLEPRQIWPESESSNLCQKIEERVMWRRKCHGPGFGREEQQTASPAFPACPAGFKTLSKLWKDNFTCPHKLDIIFLNDTPDSVSINVDVCWASCELFWRAGKSHSCLWNNLAKTGCVVFLAPLPQLWTHINLQTPVWQSTSKRLCNVKYWNVWKSSFKHWVCFPDPSNLGSQPWENLEWNIRLCWDEVW